MKYLTEINGMGNDIFMYPICDTSYSLFASKKPVFTWVLDELFQLFFSSCRAGGPR